MSIVLDASAAVAAILESETTPQVAAPYRRIVIEGAFVPQLWHFEVRNAVISNERRGRISSDQAARTVAMLNGLPVTTDDSPDLDAAMTLARAHTLTFFDALYLELTLRREAVLVSLDAALLRTAQREGAATL